MEGHPGLVALLRVRGAEMEAAVTRSGKTAMILAAQKGHVPVVELLLQLGASIDAPTSSRITTASCKRGTGAGAARGRQRRRASASGKGFAAAPWPSWRGGLTKRGCGEM